MLLKVLMVRTREHAFRTLTRAIALSLALLSLAAPAAAQAKVPLTVVLADGKEVSLTPAQLAALPSRTGRANIHGTEFAWEGHDLRDILRAAGAGPVDSLRGPMLRRVVLLTAADGYRVAIALADLDPSIGGRKAVLIEREDGKDLAPEYGPRRLIIEGDVRPSRWARQIVRISLIDVGG